MVQLDSRYIDEKEVSSAGLPVGTVLMYDANDWVNDVTLCGWYLCDGSCGTPNLVDKFVRSGNCAGTTGGSNTFTLETCHLPSHAHAGVSHSHTTTAHSHCMKCHNHGSTACAPCTGTESANHKHESAPMRPIGDAYQPFGQGAANRVGLQGGTVYTCRAALTNTECAAHRHTVCSHSHAVTGCDIGMSCTAAPNTTACDPGDTGSVGDSCSFSNEPDYYQMIYVRRMN